jgi:hypothetical protein
MGSCFAAGQSHESKIFLPISQQKSPRQALLSIIPNPAFVCHSAAQRRNLLLPLLLPVSVRHSGAARISVFAFAVALVLPEGAGGFSPDITGRTKSRALARRLIIHLDISLLSGYFSEESRILLRISMMLRLFPGTI